MPLAQYPADLLDVTGVVSSHMDCQIPDRDASTFGMYPEALPLLRGELTQKLQICRAKQTE